MASLARRWGPVAEDDLVLRDLTKIGSVSDVARTSARLSEVIREQCEGIRANVERTDRSLALYNLLAAGTAGQAVDAARSDGQDHLAKVAIVDHHEVAQHVAADQRDDRRLLTSQVRADHKVEVDRGQAGSGEAEARRVLRLLLNAAGCSDVDGADRRNAELTHDGRINGAHARARVEGAHELRILDQDELALVVLQQLGTMRVEELALLLQRVGSVHGVLRSILPGPPRLTTRASPGAQSYRRRASAGKLVRRGEANTAPYSHGLGQGRGSHGDTRLFRRPSEALVVNRAEEGCTGVPGRVPHDFLRSEIRNMVQRGVPGRVAMTLAGAPDAHCLRSVRHRLIRRPDGGFREAGRHGRRRERLGEARRENHAERVVSAGQTWDSGTAQSP